MKFITQVILSLCIVFMLCVVVVDAVKTPYHVDPLRHIQESWIEIAERFFSDAKVDMDTMPGCALVYIEDESDPEHHYYLTASFRGAIMDRLIASYQVEIDNGAACMVMNEGLSLRRAENNMLKYYHVCDKRMLYRETPTGCLANVPYGGSPIWDKVIDHFFLFGGESDVSL